MLFAWVIHIYYVHPFVCLSFLFSFVSHSQRKNQRLFLACKSTTHTPSNNQVLREKTAALLWIKLKYVHGLKIFLNENDFLFQWGKVLLITYTQCIRKMIRKTLKVKQKHPTETKKEYDNNFTYVYCTRSQ